MNLSRRTFVSALAGFVFGLRLDARDLVLPIELPMVNPHYITAEWEDVVIFGDGFQMKICEIMEQGMPSEMPDMDKTPRYHYEAGEWKQIP